MQTIWNKILIVLVAQLIVSVAKGQGTFGNLDFESATIPLSQPPSPIPGVPTVAISSALPGWAGFIGTNQVSQVMYNNQTLDTSSIALLRTNYPSLQIIDGTFSIFLMGGVTEIAQGQFIRTDTSIAQTGLIPDTAQSLQFKALQVIFPRSSISASLDGQFLTLLPLQTTAEYTLYGADVTAFRGQNRELRFTVFSSSDGGGGIGWLLDSIQFSTQPIPEPSMFGLFALGALLLGWRCLYRRR